MKVLGSVSMKQQPGKVAEKVELDTAANGPLRSRSIPRTRIAQSLRGSLVIIAALVTIAMPAAFPQQTPSQNFDRFTIQGYVHDANGKPIDDAVVMLEQKGLSAVAATRTDAAGAFALSALRTATYVLSAEKSGLHSNTAAVVASSWDEHQKVELILEGSNIASSPPIQAMTFADKPNFTVAGVTDWTAVGGHGSDSSLRTSEALANETLTLKSDNPGSSTTGMVGNARKAEMHRVAGERDEKSGDPLAAVHEFEEAARLDPSEQNYFAWGSELLLHRAVWQAQEVFQKGSDTYPKSARTLTGLGAALFASAKYDEAALHLCAASDLKPADPEPYIFMGKIEIAAPNPLECVEEKLARFVREQPGNSLANYYYAMAILKRQQQSADKQALQQAESLLMKATTIDAKFADAYLQLGILSAAERSFEKAINLYTKAIEVDPQLGEAHYRLGVAYDRVGMSAEAKQQFRLHDEIKKREAEAVERQRREVKQFVVVLGTQPS